MIHFLACAATLLMLSGVASSPASAQADPAPPSTRTSEQFQAEIEFHKADAKYYRELWEKLQADNQDLRTRVEGIEGPILAKQVEARGREIDLQGRLYAKYVEAKQREYDFASEMMTVNAYIFQHQYVAAYVVLLLVVCVVIAGLWFAHVQLMAGLAPTQAFWKAKEAMAGEAASAAAQASDAGAPAGAGPPTAPPPPLGVTSIDASFEKVTVTSSVVGVIVLLISLAFLYIYTKEIYTIRIVDPYQPKLGNPFDPNAQQKPADEKK